GRGSSPPGDRRRGAAAASGARGHHRHGLPRNQELGASVRAARARGMGRARRAGSGAGAVNLRPIRSTGVFMARDRLARSVLTAVLGLSWPVFAQAETLRYYVTVDQARVLQTSEPISKVSLANPGIADVMVLSPQQLLVTAKAVGQTSLLLFHGNKMTAYD